LYFGVPFDDCAFGYQVQSNGRLKIFNRNKLVIQDLLDTPQFANYPIEYPKIPFRLEPLTYEQERAVIYSDAWAPLKGHQTNKDRRLIESLFPFTQIGGVLPFIQGIPRHTCPNSTCPRRSVQRYGYIGPLTVVLNCPVPGLEIWGESGDWTQIVFLRCSQCGSIYTYSECD